MKIFMTEEKIRTLLAISAGKPRDHALFHVALATGLRAGDLLRLKRSQVEAQDGSIYSSIRTSTSKTGQMIERPLPDRCREALRDYLATRKLPYDNHPYLFPAESNNQTGRPRIVPMHRSSLHRIFKGYLGQLYSQDELRGNACHVTRRSVAKLISDKAGRIEPASRFLGHASIANTIFYLDMNEFDAKANEIVSKMPWN